MPAANIGIPAVRSDGPTADFQTDGRFILVQPVWGPQELVPHCTPICLCGTAILTAWFLGARTRPFSGPILGGLRETETKYWTCLPLIMHAY
jgi:hypothetical protein